MKHLQGFHPIRTARTELWEHPERIGSRFVFLLGPWVCLWMVEILNQNNVFEDLYLWQVMMNVIWYYLLFVVCRLLLGRNRRAAAAGASISFVIGLINHFVLRFRGRILFPADVAGWRTAINVADGFDFSVDTYMENAAILLVVYLFLVCVCPRQKKRAKLNIYWAGALWLFTVCYSFVFFFTDMLPSMGIYTQQWVTQHNGFLLNFTVALRYSAVDKPRDYSKQQVLELMEEYPAVEADPNVQRPVNIIAVMNESYADFSIFDRFEPSQDPNPLLHSLEDNTIRGWMYSPVTGGGTASVEFEYLTGFSTVFQPPHTVAYQLYVKEGMPSLARLTGTEGYSTTAFHPYKSSGWNRPLAYKYQSFQDQLYQEDVPSDALHVRHYVSDYADYQMLTKITEEQDTSFIFNVTMQNHSGYAQGWNNLEKSVYLPADSRQADPSAEQYFSLTRESDRAMEELLRYYRESDEPTLIVFFGDHQPPLKNAFYEEMEGKPLEDRTTEEVMHQYVVPFFIWANYDIEEQEDVILSPNYLGVLTAKTAGLPLTGYMNFLDQMHEVLPVITPVGCITADGQHLKREELGPREQEWMHRYSMLNYCGMVDLFDEARPMFCTD